MVGRSGSKVERSAVVTASPRTVPDMICAFAVVDTPTNICTVPLTVPIMAAFTSRYGTCTTFTPANLFKVSQARCGTVPDAGGCAVETTGARLRQGDEIGDRAGGHARMHDERVGNQPENRDRLELFHQIVGRELHRRVERVCG